ncbi:glycosyl transferase family protein [Vibrio ulleungensis]|uniref:Glycosyl transferase family protein n=1 Tax=Vibrio ulleungensis TaxID=2807619 RepID=A0ABS2HJF1_9VIBR|nr:glycosyl transferase family protein [Vibrio ulleungensis]MBM7036786.1 glycosyl transferase family protein [Vibrio ulleungensis]
MNQECREVSTILECIRTVGRGERGRKPLDQQQAKQIMTEYLAGEVGDDQMAMLLMLIRVNNETPFEIAGFTQAFQSIIPTLSADFDWPCYAGKKSRLDDNQQEMALPWHLIAAKILSGTGKKVLLHGHLDEGSPRVHCREYLAKLSIGMADSVESAQALLDEQAIAYLPLSQYSPQAVKMLDWKKRYGLRTPINTVVRGLNPGRANFGVRGSFHPGFQQLHAEIEQQVGHSSGAVVSFKGVSGEAEFNPKVSQTLWLSDQEDVHEHYWPALELTSLPVPKQCPLGTPSELLITMANHVYASLIVALFATNQDLNSSKESALELWTQWCSNQN